jgi:putative ABC transport system permease protein
MLCTTGWVIANYEYLDQGRATERGMIDRFLVRIKEPNRATQIGRQIDKLFASSAAPTRTSSEKAETQSGLQFIGDINFFTDAVVGAVFFMLLFITGNTMATIGTIAAWIAFNGNLHSAGGLV